MTQHFYFYSQCLTMGGNQANTKPPNPSRYTTIIDSHVLMLNALKDQFLTKQIQMAN